MDWDALLRFLGLRGMPPKLINLVSELYSGTESVVSWSDTISDVFPVVTGVHQGCVLPLHFSALLWTGLWGGCWRDQAAVCRLGMSISLTLISQMMQSFLVFMSLLAVSLRSIDVWIGLGESWIH